MRRTTEGIMMLERRCFGGAAIPVRSGAVAQKTIVYWRDIPAQVLVKAGRKSARRELPEQFIQAIDRCAMRVGAKDSDAYLAEWRRGEPQPVGDDLEAEAEAALRELLDAYPADRLKALVLAQGHDTTTDGQDIPPALSQTGQAT
jgi:hypothetical protein